MAEGIILAGGKASRIGENKLLLPYKGKPIIMHVIDAMRQHTTKIFIISGKYHQSLQQTLSGEQDVSVIYNEDYEKGMFTSVLKGIANASEDCYIMPGDMPKIQVKTFEILRTLQSDSQIYVPSYNYKRGHPIFIKQSLFPALLKEDQSSNLKRFRNNQGFITVPVDDEGVLIDIDTHKDYSMLSK